MEAIKETLKNVTKSVTTKIRNAVDHINTKPECNITRPDCPESVLNDNSAVLPISSYPLLPYDKSLWCKGTTLLVHKHTECIIVDIFNSPSSSSLDPDPSDIIIVKYENGATQRWQRNNKAIQTHPMVLKNRKKLTLYCVIDRYSLSLKQWIPDYIDNWGQLTETIQVTNRMFFAVNGKNYARWSHKIRCSPLLLGLEKGSMIFIFDADIAAYCYAKIVDVLNDPNQSNLDIFKIHYQKNGKIYLKYLHQFSASIAMLDDSIYIENILIPHKHTKSVGMVHLDETDVKYWTFLLQGLMRGGLEEDDDVFINNDVLCLLIKYIGLLYEFVMATEAKTWSLAMQNKEINMTPKETAIHDESLAICGSSGHPLSADSEYVPNPLKVQRLRISKPSKAESVMTEQNYSQNTKQEIDNVVELVLSKSRSGSISSDPPSPITMHPQEIKIKNKLIERGVFNQHNFERAIALTREKREYYISMVRTQDDEDIDYENQMVPYCQVPWCSESAIGINKDDEDIMVKLGDYLEVQSDYDIDYENEMQQEMEYVIGNNESEDDEDDDDNNNESLCLSLGDCLQVQSDYESE